MSAVVADTDRMRAVASHEMRMRFRSDLEILANHRGSEQKHERNGIGLGTSLSKCALQRNDRLCGFGRFLFEQRRKETVYGRDGARALENGVECCAHTQNIAEVPKKPI